MSYVNMTLFTFLIPFVNDQQLFYPLLLLYLIKFKILLQYSNYGILSLLSMPILMSTWKAISKHCLEYALTF